jgi:hypothetical protein
MKTRNFMVTRIIVYTVVLVIILLIILPYTLYHTTENTKKTETTGIPEGNLVVSKPAFFRRDSINLTFNLYYFPRSVAVGDIDNDGKNEVILATTEDDFYVDETIPRGVTPLQKRLYGDEPRKSILYLYRRYADGKVDRQKDYYRSFGILAGIAIADINNDGKNELIAVDSVNKTLRIFRMPSSNILLPIAEYPIPEVGTVKVGDMNGDGLSDIVLINKIERNSFTFTVLYQRTDGTLDCKTPVKNTIELDPDETVKGIAVGDTNRDGIAEFAVSHSSSKLFTVSIVDATDTHRIRELPPPNGRSYQDTSPIDIADMNSDGRNDIIVRQYGAIWVYLQENKGRFAKPNLDLKIWTGQVFEDMLKVGDIDGDGIKDFVVAVRNTSVNSPTLALMIYCRIPR